MARQEASSSLLPPPVAQPVPLLIAGSVTCQLLLLLLLKHCFLLGCRRGFERAACFPLNFHSEAAGAKAGLGEAGVLGQGGVG